MGKCTISLSFECDKTWNELQGTGSEYRFCDTCQQNVYWCDSDKDAKRHAEQGNCIGFIAPDNFSLMGRGCFLPFRPEEFGTDNMETPKDDID